MEQDTEPGRELAGSRYPVDIVGQLESYAMLLQNQGVMWGLIGPREIPRIWSRHLLNCAAVADVSEGLVPESSSVVDVGSGAGLPGIVWSLVRPDIHVTLVEPLQRRVKFLDLAVASLDVAHRVKVVRARAEDAAGTLTADVVTARAVAPMPKLVPWLAPFVGPSGTMIAIKGSSAADELLRSRTILDRAGFGEARVAICGRSWLNPPTTVIVAYRQQEGRQGGSSRRGS
ncbi:MAG: 16S rRNA (guanine(527)-N(7))-methyltransferase RsmG [Actinomycetes bacterium]